MALTLMLLLEITLAFGVHLLAASPVLLGKRGTLGTAGEALLELIRINALS